MRIRIRNPGNYVNKLTDSQESHLILAENVQEDVEDSAGQLGVTGQGRPDQPTRLVKRQV
jgi:hypothetical protein